jgi:hypothetical protein
MKIIERKLGNTGLAMIGEVLLLGDTYDRDQLWFPWISAILKFDPVVVKRRFKSKSSPSAMKREIAKPYYKSSQTRLWHHYYMRDEHQHTIPFDEHKRLSNDEYTSLRAAKYPCWEIDPASKVENPFRFILSRNVEGSDEWLLDQTRGRYHRSDYTVDFQFKSDYAMAKLRFL